MSVLQITTGSLALESADGGRTWYAVAHDATPLPLDWWAELAQAILLEQARTRAREEGGEEELQRLRRENEELANENKRLRDAAG